MIKSFPFLALISISLEVHFEFSFSCATICSSPLHKLITFANESFAPRSGLLVLFQQYQTAPKLCVHQDDQVRRGWSAKTETENYTTICEVNSQFVLGEAIKHETIATIYGVNSNFHFFSS